MVHGDSVFLEFSVLDSGEFGGKRICVNDWKGLAPMGGLCWGQSGPERERSPGKHGRRVG